MKAARRRVLPWFTGAHGLAYEGRELTCCDNRLFEPSSHNLLCNLESKPFFAIISNDLRYVPHLGPRQPLGRRLALRGIHTHVERRVVAEAEAALPVVDLRRRHPYIKQNSINPGNPGLMRRLGQLAESAVHQPETGIANRLARGNRLRITVKRHQAPLLIQTGKNAATVTAATERRVNVDAVSLDRQGLHRLIEQHRDVGAALRHSTRSPKPGGMSPDRASAARSFCCFQPASLQISKCEPMPTR